MKINRTTIVAVLVSVLSIFVCDVKPSAASAAFSYGLTAFADENAGIYFDSASFTFHDQLMVVGDGPFTIYVGFSAGGSMEVISPVGDPEELAHGALTTSFAAVGQSVTLNNSVISSFAGYIKVDTDTPDLQSEQLGWGFYLNNHLAAGSEEYNILSPASNGNRKLSVHYSTVYTYTTQARDGDILDLVLGFGATAQAGRGQSIANFGNTFKLEFTTDNPDVDIFFLDHPEYNIAKTAAVPEPASLLLFGGGMVGLVFRKKESGRVEMISDSHQWAAGRRVVSELSRV